MNFTVAAHTLGCKVNQYDTDAILRDFSALGFTVCNSDGPADIFIINTCTVTNVSSKKSRQLVSRAYRQNPNALIVAYGCYAQVEPDALSGIPGVSLVIGTNDKHRVAEMVSERFYQQKTGLAKKNKIEISKSAGKRVRAYLKVQDGCDRFCSYCIVPYARGAVSLRGIDDVAAEAEALVYNGCKEIVLSGIQIASYGKDLIKLIKRIHDVSGLERLRLSSLEPRVIDEDFLRPDLPKLCDHFHLSLQSGCDRTLERMNRRYTTTQYTQAAAAIRARYPHAALTTDIIAGFPGETDEDFAESLAFTESIGFFRIHVFAYSPKAGTPAAGFPHQVSSKVKEARSQTLRCLGEKMHNSFCKRFIGREVPVLFESKNKGQWEGHTTQYIKVRITSADDLRNRIVRIKLKKEDII